jgi:hypothetical protein
MEHDDLEFDDAGLKGAIQRAWGDERAPQRLRGRVSRLMATADSIDAAAAALPRASADQWRSRAYALTAAAVILFAVGVLVLFYRGMFDRARGGAAYAEVIPSKTEVPLTLARSMLATHAACGKLPDHHTVKDLDGKTYAALTVKLTADLGFPTLARSIGAEWKFKGAGECDVGELRGAHLLFARGDQTISVFSLPASCMNGVAPGAQYEGMVDNHAIAGFARPGAVYAVIGAGSGAGPSPSLEAVMVVRDMLLQAFEVGCISDNPDELLFVDP